MYIHILRFISFLFVFLVLSCNNSNVISKDYNIVWIVYEDQSPEFFPQYEDLPFNLPAIQSLADDGIIFNNMYSPAPVCAPARSAIITGMYPTTLGTHNMRTYNAYKPENEPSIGIPNYSPNFPDYIRPFTEYLRAVGYYCTNNAKEDYNFKISKTAWDESSQNANWKNRKEDSPFFAVFNNHHMHESGIWKQTNNNILVDKSKIKIPPYFPDTETVRHDLAVNFSNLIRADSTTSKIIKDLKDAGEYDNTYIFFYSDHGGPFPRHKRAIYDTGTKVPFIIKPPKGVTVSYNPDQLLSFIDLAPTILSIVGIDIPDYIQGKAFLGDQKAEENKLIYFATDRFDEVFDRVRGVSDGNYRYVRNYDTSKPHGLNNSYRMQIPMMRELVKLHKNGKLNKIQSFWLDSPKPAEELYDLSEDPYEINNLVDSERHTEILNKLSINLDNWIMETNDLGKYPEKELIPEEYLN